jgi:hypothetical protein
MNIAHMSYDATLLNRHSHLSGDLLITHSQDENYVIPAKDSMVRVKWVEHLGE